MLNRLLLLAACLVACLPACAQDVAYTTDPKVAGAMVFQGTYASGTTYALGDVVTISSVAYVSKAGANLGNNPATDTTHWAVLANATVNSNGSVTVNGKTGSSITLVASDVGADASGAAASAQSAAIAAAAADATSKAAAAQSAAIAAAAADAASKASAAQAAAQAASVPKNGDPSINAQQVWKDGTGGPNSCPTPTAGQESECSRNGVHMIAHGSQADQGAAAYAPAVNKQDVGAISWAALGGHCGAILDYPTTDGVLKSTGTTHVGNTGALFTGNPTLEAGYVDDTAGAWHQAALLALAATNQLGYTVETTLGQAPGVVITFPDNCQPVINTDSDNMPGGVLLKGINVNIVGIAGTAPSPRAVVKSYSVNAWNLPGQSRFKMEGITITSAMPRWTLTSTDLTVGLYVEGGASATLRDIGVFGFPIGKVFAGMEYVLDENAEYAYNRVNRLMTTGTVSPGSPGYPWPVVGGLASVDGTFINEKSRGGMVNRWWQAANAETDTSGTMSYALLVPDRFGKPLDGYIASVTVGAPTNGSAIGCTANSRIKLTTTDTGAGRGAEISYLCNGAGNGGVIDISFAGKHYNASSTTITAASGFANPPVFTPVTGTMKGWAYYDGQPTNGVASEITISGMNAEALKGYQYGPTASGAIVSGDDSMSGITYENNFFLPETTTSYTHIADFEAGSSDITFRGNSGMTIGPDPWDGTTCPLLAGNSGVYNLQGPDGRTPVNQACDLSAPLVNGAKQYVAAGKNGGIVRGTPNQFSEWARPRVTAANGSAQTFAVDFTGGQAGLAPSAILPGSPSGSGIPVGYSCAGLWSWGGQGSTPATAAYYATARCVGGSSAPQDYASTGTFGAESWTLVPAASGGPTSYTASGTGGTSRSYSQASTEAPINPRQYGAPCTGSGDDTPGLQNAFNAAAARFNSTGNKVPVVLPTDGACVVSGQVLGASGVALTGPGRIIIPSQHTAPSILFQNAGHVSSTDVNYDIQGHDSGCATGTNNALCTVLAAQTTSAVTNQVFTDLNFTGNTISDPSWGILIQSQAGNNRYTNVHVDKNTVISTVAYTYRDGIHVSGYVTGWTAIGNIVNGRGDAAIAASSEVAGAYPCSGGTITGNTGLEDAVGIDISGCSDITIAGNTVKATVSNSSAGPAFRAIQYAGVAAKRLKVIGNIFQGNPSSGENDAKFDMGGITDHVTTSSFTGNTLKTFYYRASVLDVTGNTFIPGAHVGCDFSDGTPTDSVTLGTNTWQGTGQVDCNAGAGNGNLTNDYIYPQNSIGTNLTLNVNSLIQGSYGSGGGSSFPVTPLVLAGNNSASSARVADTNSMQATLASGSPDHNASQAALFSLGLPFIFMDATVGGGYVGTYSNSTGYSFCNVVQYSGAAYMSLTNNTGVTPGSDPTKWWPLTPSTSTSSPSNADCAWYKALKQNMDTFLGVTVVAGPHHYQQFYRWDQSNGLQGHAVSLNGDNMEDTFFDAQIDMPQQMYAPYQSGNFANFDLSHFTMQGNNHTDNCTNFRDLINGRYIKLRCTGVKNEATPYFSFGEVGHNAQELFFDYLVAAGPGYYDPNNPAVATVTGSGDPTVTLTQGGAGYNADPTLNLVTFQGFGLGDHPCVTNPVYHVTVSGNSIASLVKDSAGVGCVPPMYVNIVPMTKNTGFNMIASDSTMFNIYPQAMALGIDIHYGNSVYYHPHCVNVLDCIRTTESTVIHGLELDTVTRYGIIFAAGEGYPTVEATNAFSGITANLKGEVPYYFPAGSNGAKIIGGNSLCTFGKPAGYQTMLTASGPVSRSGNNLINAPAGVDFAGDPCNVSLGAFSTIPKWYQTLGSDTLTANTLLAPSLCLTTGQTDCTTPSGKQQFTDDGNLLGGSTALGSIYSLNVGGGASRTATGFQGNTGAQINIVGKDFGPAYTVTASYTSGAPGGTVIQVRASPTPGNRSQYYYSPGMGTITKVSPDGGTTTTVASGCASASANDLLSLSVTAANLLTARNLTTNAAPCSGTDATYFGGGPGFLIDSGSDSTNRIQHFKVVSDGGTPSNAAAKVATGTSANTDAAGQLTLSGGTATYTFTGTYASAPICNANDTTALNPVRSPSTTTTLTLTGTGSDVINYTCTVRN